MARYKRRNNLIKPRLQIKLVSIFLCLSISCILLQFALLNLSLTEVAMRTTAGLALSNEVHDILWTYLFITLGLLIPLVLLVGILVTFRIAGPVYRMEQYLQSIIAGENPGPCHVREGDEFQELCDLLNGAIETIKERSGLTEDDGAAPTSDEETVQSA